MVKVKVIGCSVLQIGNDKYVNGDIIEVPESMVEASPDLYEKVEKSVKKKAIVEEVVTEALAVVAPLEEVTEEPKPKTRRRRS